MNTSIDVDTYIATFPTDIQERLQQLRTIIKEQVPQAEEKISYGMPAYKLSKMLVYFAGYAKHTGFYPGAACILAFKEQINSYKSAKGSVQFPHSKPLPTELIRQMIAFRLKENLIKK